MLAVEFHQVSAACSYAHRANEAEEQMQLAVRHQDQAAAECKVLLAEKQSLQEEARLSKVISPGLSDTDFSAVTQELGFKPLSARLVEVWGMMKYKLTCVSRLVATMLQDAKEETQKQAAHSEQRLAKLEQEIGRLQVTVFKYLLYCHCC